jgi:hypothetical protein
MAEPAHEPNGGFRSRSRLVLLAFLAIAGFFLITEHTAHVLGILPYLLLLACPLIHLFHGGHGHAVAPGSAIMTGRVHILRVARPHGP